MEPLQKFTFTRIRFEPHSNREVGRPRITTVRKTCVGGQARGGGPGSCTPPPRPDTGPQPRVRPGHRSAAEIGSRRSAWPLSPCGPPRGTSDPAFHPGLLTPQSGLIMIRTRSQARPHPSPGAPVCPDGGRGAKDRGRKTGIGGMRGWFRDGGRVRSSEPGETRRGERAGGGGRRETDLGSLGVTRTAQSPQQAVCSQATRGRPEALSVGEAPEDFTNRHGTI